MYSLIIRGFPLRIGEGKTQRVRTPEDAYRMMEDVASLPNEVFAVLAMNSKNFVIDKFMVTQGILDASLVHPREVFRHAIIVGAAAIVLSHNHPSGDPTPSAEDILITKQLIEAGRIVDIKVLDHVVVSINKPPVRPFVSLRESGIVEFT